MTLRHLILAAYAGLAAAAAPTLQAQPMPAPDAEAQAALAVLQAHFDALNRGDAAASAALMHEQIIYTAGAGCMPHKPCRGKAAADAGFVQPSAKMQMKVTLQPVAQRFGENFSTGVQVSWSGIDAAVPGVQRLVGLDMFRVADGKVAMKHFLPDMTDAQTALFYKTMAERARAAK